MRWDGLFDDLEAEAGALEVAERAGELGERTRIEVAQLRVMDRLRPALGRGLRLSCVGELVCVGRLTQVGSDWLLLDEGAGHEALVRLATVLTLTGLGRVSAAPGSVGVVQARLGIASVLRAVSRDRSSVLVHLLDGSTRSGTIDRVGADFLELAAHAPGEPRRRGDVREMVLVPTASLVALRRGVGA